MGRVDRMPGVSDHQGVLAQSLIKARYQRPQKRKILLWDKTDISAIKDQMALFAHSFLQDFNITTPVEQLWTAFKAKCSDILENHVKYKWSSERFNQPWITRRVKRITRRQKRAHMKARRTIAHSAGRFR